MQARKQPPTRAWREWLLAGVGLAYVAGFMLAVEAALSRLLY